MSRHELPHIMGLQPVHDKGPNSLLWGVSQTAHEKVTVRRTPKRHNYCVIFIVCA